jgi:lysozyme family protein
VSDAIFDAAVTALLANEGGYKPASADDPGGETKFGISKRSYPNEDIPNLTAERARAIYFTDFWLRFRISQLPGASIPVKLLDAAVPMGGPSAIRCLQRALRAAGVPADEDGVIGPATAKACSAALGGGLRAALRSEIAAHYRLVAQSKPAEAPNLPGWLNRAYQ